MALIATTPLVFAAFRSPSKDVLADVIRLFGEDDVARFNPTEHDATLRAIVEIPILPAEATTGIEESGNRVDPVANAEILRHFSDVLFDLLSDRETSAPPRTILAHLEQSLPALLAAEDYEHLESVIRRLLGIAASGLGDELKSAAHESLGRISRVVVEKATNASDEHLAKIRRLIDALDVHARQTFLENLALESNRARRRRLFRVPGPRMAKLTMPRVFDWLGMLCSAGGAGSADVLVHLDRASSSDRSLLRSLARFGNGR